MHFFTLCMRVLMVFQHSAKTACHGKTNQNAGFFQLQCLKNELGYDVSLKIFKVWLTIFQHYAWKGLGKFQHTLRQTLLPGTGEY